MTTKLKGAVRADDYFKKLSGPMTFGRFLAAVRLNMDISQAELARRLKVTRSRICDIEKERIMVSPAFARKIAKMGGFPEQLAVTYCLQDQLRKAKINYEVKLKVA